MPTAKFWAGMSLVAGLAPAFAGALAAAQLTAPPDRDNTLFEEFALQEGCFAATSNGAGRYIFSGFTNNGLERRAVLHFDLSAIPPGSTISVASVTLNLNRVGSGAAPFVTRVPGG